MKKTILTFGLFSLMMVLTSFTSPIGGGQETRKIEIGGGQETRKIEIGGGQETRKFEIGGGQETRKFEIGGGQETRKSRNQKILVFQFYSIVKFTFNNNILKLSF